jgi:hypothetical protein
MSSNPEYWPWARILIYCLIALGIATLVGLCLTDPIYVWGDVWPTL